MAIKLTELQKSALLEAGNIGAGHAAIALSQLMGRKIMIAIPSIETFELSTLASGIDGKNAKLVHVSLSVLGTTKGIMTFMLENTRALALCDIVMGQKKGKTKTLGDLEQSALKEIGSILAASYLNAISEMTGLSLVISTPDYDLGPIDLLEKVLARKELDLKKVKDVICIKTEFIEATTKIDGYLIFIPAQDAIDKVMGRLGV